MQTTAFRLDVTVKNYIYITSYKLNWAPDLGQAVMH